MRGLVLSACGCLSGCGDLRESYGREYVLYDSRRAAAPGTPAPAAKPGPSASTNGTIPARTDAGLDPLFARILELESVRVELERAILDGLDRAGTLAHKRREVDDELRERLQAAGERLPGWRAARAAQLALFARQATGN